MEETESRLQRSLCLLSLSLTQVICSYILRPMVFMMGVEWADCPMVAEMVGIKFFTNEFVAYQQLSQYKNKRLSGVEEWIGGEKQWISVSDNLEKHKQSRQTKSVTLKFNTHRSLSRVPGLTTKQE